MNIIKLLRPNGLHEHLREMELLKKIIQLFNIYGWVVAMGNLKKSVFKATDVKQYRQEIKENNILFEPIMTVMLVNGMTPQILREAWEAGARILKLIPGGASTHSDECVSLENLHKYYNVLRTARDLNMIFAVHWELAIDPKIYIEIDRIYRETRAIPYLKDLIREMPGLIIIVEHISTAKMLEVVLSSPNNVFATATAHHSVLSQKDLYNGGVLNPHLLCNPILKSPHDAEAILRQINSRNNTKIGFGGDCAAHFKTDKESKKPPYGIFAPPQIAIPLIIQKSEELGILDLKALNNFFNLNGTKVYSLPPATEYIILERKPWKVASEYNGIVPLWAGKTLNWRIISPENNMTELLEA